MVEGWGGGGGVETGTDGGGGVVGGWRMMSGREESCGREGG